MIWLIITMLIFTISTVVVVYSMISQVNEQKAVVLMNLKILQNELEEKKEILKECAEINLGLVDAALCDEIRSQITAEEESMRAEKGKVTITQAELEAVDIRLRELEEIEKELESSSIEASRELEMLRTQERDVQVKNQRLQEALENTVIRLDKLAHEVASVPGASALLTTGKNSLIEGQKKIEFFDKEISMINHKYMDLKRAYDALDIEYAQLYEKQSQA